MTAEQMKYEFDVGYDRITNFDAPGYVPKEISTFLTRAQESIIYEILKSSAYTERNKKAMSMLRQVLPLTRFTAGNYPNGFLTSLQTVLDGSLAGSFAFFVRSGAIPAHLDAGGVNFVTAGFRVGDRITISGTSTNDGNYTLTGVAVGKLDISIEENFTFAVSAPNILITADPILTVRNERADIELTTNFYFDRIPVVPATDPVTYNNLLLDIEVDPTDDDFYNANKSNPYKKPNIEKIWRIDGANSSQKQHEYITDGTFDLTTIHLHIDRKPRAIIVPETPSTLYDTADGRIDGIYFVDYRTGLNCNLDESIHRDIVEKAVKLAYAALQDEKGFQISSVQEQQE